jgi:hypothetical protein
VKVKVKVKEREPKSEVRHVTKRGHSVWSSRLEKMMGKQVMMALRGRNRDM